MSKKIACETTIVLVVFFLLSVLPAVYATDEIEITYMYGGTAYWYGRGILSSEIDGDEFVFNTNGVEIVSFSSGFVPIKKDGDKITFIKTGKSNKFECSFLSKKPTGRGVYLLSLNLPEIHKEKDIEIKLEKSPEIIYSNIDLKKNNVDDFIVLKSKTDKRDLSLIYMTDTAYYIFLNTIIFCIFILIMLGYLFLKRKEIKKKFVINCIDSKAGGFAQFREKEDGFELLFDFNRLKKIIPNRLLSYDRGILSIKFHLSIILIFFIFAVLSLFLIKIIIFSLKNWEFLRWYVIVLLFIVLLICIVFILCAFTFIGSAKNINGIAKRTGIVGGVVIWIVFGYLGFNAILLGLVTGILIYALSFMVLRDGED